MATADSVKSKLQELIDQANAATGKTDADLTAAVGRLIAGFGQGGGGALIIGTDNLHDSSTDIENIYLNNGVETSYSGWLATDYIPIKADTVYAVQVEYGNANGSYCALYDSEKNYAKNIGGGLQNVPDCVSLFFGIDGYIRFSGVSTIINNLSLYECTGSLEFDTEQSAVAALSDDIPAEMALDILTGGGPAE